MSTAPLPVVDPDDERLAPYRDLRDATARAARDAAGRIFVVEGRLAVAALLRSPYAVVSLLLAENRAGPDADLVAGVAAAGAPVYVASRAVLGATVGFDLHRGVVAIGARREAVGVDAVLADAVPAGAGGAATVVVLEGVNDAENLGAVFRNAAALGAAAVLLDPTCADPLYRRSVRVSLGHVLGVPFARFPSWPEGLGTLAAAGWRTVALTPRGDVDLAEVPAGGRTAVLLGAEGPGLSDAALAAAAVRARIPMRAGVDSLNVATAAALALHRLAAPVGEGAGPAR